MAGWVDVELVDGGEVEEIGFYRDDAVEAPGGVGQGLDEIGFGGALGMVFVCEGFEVALVGFEVLGGHDYDLAGESVAEGVEGGRCLPASVLGPVECWELARLISARSVGCVGHLVSSALV